MQRTELLVLLIVRSPRVVQAARLSGHVLHPSLPCGPREDGRGDVVPPLGFDHRQYRTDHYHQVADEITAEWDLSGLARDLEIVMATVRRVDADDSMPRWNAGNEFEGAWRELHGIEE